jgi:hypothetical protein
MTTISIDELGQAIAFHLRDYDTRTYCLPAPASKLIDVYGTMNYYGQVEISWEQLGVERAGLVREALQSRLQLSLNNRE